MVSTLKDLASRAAQCTKPEKEIMKELQKTRKQINDIGLFLRADFTAKGKMVIAKEKELLGIIVPEEDRLKKIEADEKLAVEMAYRKSQLPDRMKKLEKYGSATEEFLNDLDDEQFNLYLNDTREQWNLAEERKLEEQRKEVEKAQNEIAIQAKMKEAEEKGKKEAEERTAKELAEAKQRAEQAEATAKRNAEIEVENNKQKEIQESIARVVKEAEEKKKMEADETFKTFLENNGCTEDNKAEFKVIREGGEIKLYKLVATMPV